MNLISCNCAGASIYKFIINKPYNNPFIWCLTDVVSLAKYWGHINFHKIRIFNEHDLDGIWHINIDNKVDVRYVHAVFDPNAQQVQIIQPTPTQNAEIRYNKIWEYLTYTYYKRLARMDVTEPPLYVLYNANKVLPQLSQYTDRIIDIPVDTTGGIVHGVISARDYIMEKLAMFGY